MPSQYIDRGIIKWAPFDALVGYGAMIREMKLRLGKKDKPILSDDQYEELNRKLSLAVLQGIDVEIEYFFEGYIRTTFGKIRKLDPIQGWIILDTFERINASNITDIIY